MQELVQKVAESQWSGVALAGVAFIVGFAMWASGRRMLRTAFAGGGMIVGAIAGLAMCDVPRIAEVGVPAWVITLTAALLMAVLFVAAYRLALAASIGILLAGAAPVVVVAGVENGWIELNQGQSIVAQPPLASAGVTEEVLNSFPPPPIETIETDSLAGGDAAGDLSASVADELPRWRQWLTATWDAVSAAPQRIWQESSEQLRIVLVGTAGAGAVVGLVIGAAAPSLGASLLTSLFGSLLLLGSGWTFAMKLNLPVRFMPQSSLAWLTWWMAAAVIGLILQWIFRAKPADK